MSEREFVSEQASLNQRIESVTSRLTELENTDSYTDNDNNLFASASYYILTQKLLSNRTVDYKSLLKEIDPRILKDFIRTVSNNFCIKNGRVMSITFKNGIKHEFIYKEN